MKALVESLYKSMKSLDAPEAHFTGENSLNTQNLTVVVSVYDNMKPAERVLRELVEWAEEEENQALLDKIEALQSDMSWNPQLSASQSE